MTEIPKPVDDRRRRKRAKGRGKQFEDWCCSQLRRVWPWVKRRQSANFGVKRSDATDERTPFTFEFKKRADWISKAMEGHLEQAVGYADQYDESKIPVVVTGNSMGKGSPQRARVYMNFEDWLLRELYINELEEALRDVQEDPPRRRERWDAEACLEVAYTRMQGSPPEWKES